MSASSVYLSVVDEPPSTFRLRLALVGFPAGGAALFSVMAALPGASPDPEGIKPVVVAWMRLVLDSDCGPDYRFSAQKPPPEVVERSLREIKRLWGPLLNEPDNYWLCLPKSGCSLNPNW